jgi:hypothetical protein
MFKYNATGTLCSLEVRKTRNRYASYCNYCNIASSSCNKMCAEEINVNLLREHSNLHKHKKIPNKIFEFIVSSRRIGLYFKYSTLNILIKFRKIITSQNTEYLRFLKSRFSSIKYLVKKFQIF